MKRKRQRRIPEVFVQPITLAPLEITEEPLYRQIETTQRDSPEYMATRARWHRLQSGEERAQNNCHKTMKNNHVAEYGLIWYKDRE